MAHTEGARQIVLAIDDERAVRELIRSALEAHGMRCIATADPGAALEALATQPVDVILTGLHMPGMTGVEVLERAHRLDPDLPVILMTGLPTVDSAIRSLKDHAYDYLTKPFHLDELIDVVGRALEKRRLVRENAVLKDTLMLVQLSQAVAASVDEREVLDLVLRSAARELDAERVTLFVRPEPDEPLKRWRDGPSANGPWADAEAQLARLAAEGGEAILAPEDSGDGLLPEGLQSAIAVPLRTPAGTVGALVAARPDRARPFARGNLQTLAILAGNAAAVIANARYARQVVETRAGLAEANVATIGALVSALDAREHETQVHSLRVTEFALRLASQIDLPPAERLHLRFGAMLHDIGKIGIADAILLKPGPLTDEEWEQMRRHPMIGYQILRDIKFLEGAARIVLYHQERYDGTGYPFGLAGDEIPLGARLFAIVDTFDAMTSDRPYRPALAYDDVVAELVRHRGGQFDPALVDAFLAIPRGDWERIREETARSEFPWQAIPRGMGFPMRGDAAAPGAPPGGGVDSRPGA